MDRTHFECKTRSGLPGQTLRNSLIPADVLVLILSLLHGQDIARCTMTCHYIADIVRSDLYLQYKIELAQNGMTDGESSTLPVSERLHRLREYASRFRNGNFDHEDLSAHPYYIRQIRRPPPGMLVPRGMLSYLYAQTSPSDMVLSVFIPPSAQAGIQSSRCILPIGTAGEPGLTVAKRAIDRTQDLLVMAEVARTDMPEHQRRRSDEVRIGFYLRSGRGSEPIMPTSHPEAARPAVHFVVGPGAPGGMQDDLLQPDSDVDVEGLHIAGKYVMWELSVRHSNFRRMYVEVCEWRTGEVISRIDVGARPPRAVVPLGYPYLLVCPLNLKEDPHLHIYSFVTSQSPHRRICSLRLPNEILADDERIDWHTIHTGDRQQPSEGHFHADLSRSMVVLQLYIVSSRGERVTHYCIPRTTLLAQIRNAEGASQKAPRADGGTVQPQPVPWADWGAQGCLRLSLRGRRTMTIPFGSRLPLLVADESDGRRAAVYVFDVNPHVARYQNHVLATARERSSTTSEDRPSRTTGIVEDIEAVLPGVVDPDCSGIPYVSYRFELPYGPAGWRGGHMIGAVIMGMTGFTVRMAGVEYEKTEQAWTV